MKYPNAFECVEICSTNSFVDRFPDRQDPSCFISNLLVQEYVVHVTYYVQAKFPQYMGKKFA